MKHVLALVIAGFFPLQALAAGAETDPMADLIRPAGDTDIAEFQWLKRPIVVFADTPADPRFAEQIQLLERDLAALADRDVVVLTDTDPGAMSPVRRQLRPRGFMLVLIAKDGTVHLRKPFPWRVRELTRSIDKMPMRQREIRERRTGG